MTELEITSSDDMQNKIILSNKDIYVHIDTYQPLVEYEHLYPSTVFIFIPDELLEEISNKLSIEIDEKASAKFLTISKYIVLSAI